MFKIRNKRIDFIDAEPLFTSRLNAVYQLECDSNYKLYLGHILEDKLLYALEDLIGYAENSRILPNCLAQAILESEVLTIKIVYVQELSDNLTQYSIYKRLLEKKFELIRDLKTYTPYGLNDLRYVMTNGHSKESTFAKSLISELRNRGEQYYIKLSPKAKKVYQYDKKTGEFIREYASMTDAAVDVGVTLSSITGCCMGRNKSAGGYLWSYTKRATVNAFRDARFLNTPSTEERVKALQQRIGQYTKLFNYAEEN